MNCTFIILGIFLLYNIHKCFKTGPISQFNSLLYFEASISFFGVRIQIKLFLTVGSGFRPGFYRRTDLDPDQRHPDSIFGIKKILNSNEIIKNVLFMLKIEDNLWNLIWPNSGTIKMANGP